MKIDFGVYGRLASYRLRAGLAAVGVAIGAATMVLLANLIGSAHRAATASLEGMGGRLLFVSSQAAPLATITRIPVPVTADDASFLRRRASLVETAAPMMAMGVSIRGCGRTTFSRLVGVVPQQQALEGWAMAAGRYIADHDVAAGARVVVVGAGVVRLMPCLSEQGALVTVAGRAFRVVGAVRSRGAADAAGDADQVVFAPYSTVEAIAGSAQRPVTLLLLVRRADRAAEAADEVASLLRLRHRIAEGEPDDFVVRSQEQIVGTIRQVANTLTLGLAFVLGWTLVVAAVGILNSVFTAVLERTPEIGLRRAAGATRRIICLQFLVEALIVSTAGALAGIALGIVASAVIVRLLDGPLFVNWSIAAVALAASVLLGLLAGIWPALKAGAMPPVEALRYE